MKKMLLGVVLLLGALVLAFTFVSAQDTEGSGDERYEGTIAAPEFPSDLDWFNVPAPLTMDGLRGKIVLFDFWTYGCINCIHMIPVLRELEEKYAEELVVIGVHSAKFENEGESENIRQIIERYDLHHPVINDSDFRVWRMYGVNAWPTFLIIDPRGNVVAAQSGEVPFEAFDRYFTSLIEYYDNLGLGDIQRSSLELTLEGAGDPGTPLLFPGKVLVDEVGGRLFIADSNHHRIVIADLATNEVLATIGSGQRGYQDGSYSDTQFDQPQGMEIVGETLYIADVNNHVIRAVDLTTQTVTTIAGTGRMGRGFVDVATIISEPKTFDLRSPWDVRLGDNNILYIAMAGMHQIWQLDLATNELRTTVGNGREANLNAALLSSELAQPSGLFYHDGLLYFADSESSTIRVADIPSDRVFLASGTDDNSLFDFGDVDGLAGESRLQHALGVVGTDDASLIYIADTYNSRIKVYDPQTSATVNLAGLGGNGGYRDGSVDLAEFDEPGGIDYSNGKLYIADTNNHVIRIIDLTTNSVSTLQFPNPQALVIEESNPILLGGNSAEGLEIRYDEQLVAAGEGSINLSITIPEGYKINPLIDSYLELSSDSSAIVFADDSVSITGELVMIPLGFVEGSGTAQLSMTLFYCEAEQEAFCLIDEATLLVPVQVGTEGQASFNIERVIELPEGFAG